MKFLKPKIDPKFKLENYILKFKMYMLGLLVLRMT